MVKQLQQHDNTLCQVEDGKQEKYLPTKRLWSGYLPFACNQNQIPHIFTILTCIYKNIQLQKYFTVSNYILSIRLDNLSKTSLQKHTAVHT